MVTFVTADIDSVASKHHLKLRPARPFEDGRDEKAPNELVAALAANLWQTKLQFCYDFVKPATTTTTIINSVMDPE